MLANLELTPKTFKGVLERARDQDPEVRKLLYKKLQIDVERFFALGDVELIVNLFDIGLNDR